MGSGNMVRWHYLTNETCLMCQYRFVSPEYARLDGLAQPVVGSHVS